MAVLIDSSVFIGLERRGLPIQAIGAEIPSDESVALSAITASELLVGVHRAVTQAQRVTRESLVEAILSAFPILPFDLQVARIHARLLGELLGSGQTVGAHDLLIAATALAFGYNVLTDNLRDFQKVPGLQVRQPRWR
ncbi:MAG: type II toxin-antitoxin system VapC family toxin [Dehalococcoidia bacterium]|nr:type II toxin-antitoxin system VapC family toxin [Dehalococcoidia bacterium]